MYTCVSVSETACVHMPSSVYVYLYDTYTDAYTYMHMSMYVFETAYQEVHVYADVYVYVNVST